MKKKTIRYLPPLICMCRISNKKERQALSIFLAMVVYLSTFSVSQLRSFDEGASGTGFSSCSMSSSAFPPLPGVAPLLTVLLVATVAICVVDACAVCIVVGAVVAGKPVVFVVPVDDDAALAAFCLSIVQSNV